MLPNNASTNVLPLPSEVEEAPVPTEPFEASLPERRQLEELAAVRKRWNTSGVTGVA